jgi:hypothetical protein
VFTSSRVCGFQERLKYFRQIVGKEVFCSFGKLILIPRRWREFLEMLRCSVEFLWLSTALPLTKEEARNVNLPSKGLRCKQFEMESGRMVNYCIWTKQRPTTSRSPMVGRKDREGISELCSFLLGMYRKDVCGLRNKNHRNNSHWLRLSMFFPHWLTLISVWGQGTWHSLTAEFSVYPVNNLHLLIVLPVRVLSLHYECTYLFYRQGLHVWF